MKAVADKDTTDTAERRSLISSKMGLRTKTKTCYAEIKDFLF